MMCTMEGFLYLCVGDKVQVTNTQDYLHAFFKGPWMVASHYLIIQRWRPTFLENAKSKGSGCLGQVPRLPLELYHDTFLHKVKVT
ncbi:hypothetical protein CR513_37506, partial [Mucuna pruriens]